MSKHILIVEGCDIMRKLLSYILKERGYDIVSTSNAADAIRIVDSMAIDLVITNSNTSDTDGLDLSSNLRSSERHKDIPIILVTTEHVDGERVSGKGGGVSTYLVKPITPKKLICEIERLI